MRTFIIALALALGGLAAPALAQGAIGQVEAGEAVGADGVKGPTREDLCETCCLTKTAEVCAREGCPCFSESPGGCGSVAAMALSGTGLPTIQAKFGSILEARSLFAGSQRGRRLLGLHDDNVGEIVALLRSRPRLAKRMGDAVTQHWPTSLDARVEPAALTDLRAVLTEVGKASGDGPLPRVIRRQVLPRLDDGLVGRTHREAIGCFLDGC